MKAKEKLSGLRMPENDNPLRLLMSACLAGTACGYDGSSYGEYPGILKLFNYQNVKITKFCPEEFSFGTPREMCDIHGGDGLDVLEGRARVLTESGNDWTEGMIRASEKMLELAKKEDIELAIMMDISAACGSCVIYDGNRFSENKIYQIGAGVCAAQLIRNGFLVISQRDFASYEILLSKIDSVYVPDLTKVNHNESEWYRNYFQV